MAVKQYSQRLTLQLFTVLLLGWLALLIWSISLWVTKDYNYVVHKVDELISSQRKAITPVYPNSILSTLPVSFNYQWRIEHPLLKKLAINHFIEEFIHNIQLFLKLVQLISQYIFIKLVILVAAIPLFSLAMLAGMVDGLNQRAIRKACLGRESSYVFHQLNHYLKRGLLVVLILWLAIPVSIAPSYVFIPVSLILGVTVAMTASRFKKYI